MNEQNSISVKLAEVASRFDDGNLYFATKYLDEDENLEFDTPVVELTFRNSTLNGGQDVVFRAEASYVDWQDVERIENDIKVSIATSELIKDHFIITL